MAGRPRTANPEPYPAGWEPFMAAIKADMDDDTPRLVFADWLQENGDEDRAEFIRLQCELARGVPADAARADALLVANFREWLRGFPRSIADNPARCTFRRGFPAAISVKGDRFVSEGEALCRLTPVEELAIDAVTTEALRLPALAGIPKLTLPLLNSAKVEALASSPVLPGLVEFSTSWGNASQRSMRDLFANPALARLSRLSVQNLGVGNAVAEALAASGHLARLEALCLKGTGSGTASAEAIAHGSCRKLRILNLRSNPIGDAGLRLLIDSPYLRNLVGLDLRWCNLTPAAATMLAGWEGLKSIRALWLYEYDAGPAFAVVAASPYAANLCEGAWDAEPKV